MFHSQLLLLMVVFIILAIMFIKTKTDMSGLSDEKMILLNHRDIESVHLKLNQFCKNILQFWNVLLLELKTQNVEWQ